MEGMEEVEFMGSSSNNDATVSVTTTHIAKGKRTKRQRPFSPCAVVAAMACSSSSVSGEHVSGGAGGDCGSISSTTTTTNNYESTEEEEDMANCLILLAQGRGSHHHKTKHQPQSQSEAARSTERGGSRRFTEMPTATSAAASAAAKIGFYVYECKTCNRTFPSFQALGGHRASHKKPKLAPEEKKPPPPPTQPPIPSQLINNYEIEEAQIRSSPQISLQLGGNIGVVQSNKAKIHECSICGSEFTSGQALGGHMRRHRASTTTTHPAVGIETGCNVPNDVTTGKVQAEPRNILALDLNLPAPEEDLRDSKFQFAPKQKPLVLSAPSLVDCHY